MPLWYLITASIAFLGALTMIVTIVGGFIAITRGSYEENAAWWIAALIGLAVMTMSAMVIVFFGYVIA